MIFPPFLCFISNTYKSFFTLKPFKMLENTFFHWWFENSQTTCYLILQRALDLSWTLANDFFHLLSHSFSIVVWIQILSWRSLWFIKDIRFLFNVSLKISLRFHRLSKVCGVMTRSENSSEKEGGSSLWVDLGSIVLKPTGTIGVLFNLLIDQCSRYRRNCVEIFTDGDLGASCWRWNIQEAISSKDFTQRSMGNH